MQKNVQDLDPDLIQEQKLDKGGNDTYMIYSRLIIFNGFLKIMRDTYRHEYSCIKKIKHN